MKGHLTREKRLQTIITRLKNKAEEYRVQIKELTLQLKEKDKRIFELETKLVDKETQRKELLSYLYKPNKQGGETKDRGKKPGSLGYHRPIPAEEAVTFEYTYRIKRCPICKREVGDVVDTVIKYQEDITLKPRPTVTKHKITRHWCAHCETYVKSADIPPLSRIGIKTMGYVLYARYRLRLPMRKIQESLHDLYDFSISGGEIVELLKDAERLFGKDYEALKNWWLWVFATTNGTQYVIEDSRGKGVAEKVLGEKEDRVIISDGYAAYKNLPGEKQQCWVHLMRAAKLHSRLLYEDLVILYKELLLELEKPLGHRDKGRFEKRFDELINKPYSEPRVEKVKKRMRRDKAVLFTCLEYKDVLPENNTAERAIRPQVVMRKIFGGSRSLEGASTHQVNSSVIETLRKQHPGQDFFDFILPLLEKRSSGL
jgi:hypothetical protein